MSLSWAQKGSYSFPTSLRIIEACESLNTMVSLTVLQQFLDSLTAISEEGSELCLNSLDQYNQCTDSKEELYPKVMVYMDDLVGKQIERVTVENMSRPWTDEDYYHLRVSFHYKNDDPSFDVEYNFDTIIFGVNEGKIKNIIYAREWIDLDNYGK